MHSHQVRISAKAMGEALSILFSLRSSVGSSGDPLIELLTFLFLLQFPRETKVQAQSKYLESIDGSVPAHSSPAFAGLRQQTLHPTLPLGPLPFHPTAKMQSRRSN
jgi:hypothetical protein